VNETTPKTEQLVLLLILGGHKDGDEAYKHKNHVRAGAPDLRDGELDEVGLR